MKPFLDGLLVLKSTVVTVGWLEADSVQGWIGAKLRNRGGQVFHGGTLKRGRAFAAVALITTPSAPWSVARSTFFATRSLAAAGWSAVSATFTSTLSSTLSSALERSALASRWRAGAVSRPRRSSARITARGATSRSGAPLPEAHGGCPATYWGAASYLVFFNHLRGKSPFEITGEQMGIARKR